MASRTTITLDDDMVEKARALGINVSAASRQGVADAIRAAQMAADIESYRTRPEVHDDGWDDIEAWGPE